MNNISFSTGSCAAVAAKAAALVLDNKLLSNNISIKFPDGLYRSMSIAWANKENNIGKAAVIKNSGLYLSDISNNATIIVSVKKDNSWCFQAGNGVGIVTKPGLPLPIGEAAINNGPRQMIRSNLQELGWSGAIINISIPNGAILAVKTFNQRLGIINGLSILGTTGLVRPFSEHALRVSIGYMIDVIQAIGHKTIGVVPGNLGKKALENIIDNIPIVEVLNEWGYALDVISNKGFKAILVAGHPSKLVKLSYGDFDTHSARSMNPVKNIQNIANSIFGYKIYSNYTTEGIFTDLDKYQKQILAKILAKDVALAIKIRTGLQCAVIMTDMNNGIYGAYLKDTIWDSVNV